MYLLKGRFYVQFGTILYILSGIPVPLQPERELTIAELTTALVFYTGLISNSVVDLYIYLQSTSQFEGRKIGQNHYDLTWVLFPIGNVIIATVMIARRRKIVQMYKERLNLDQIPGTGPSRGTWKGAIVLLYIAAMVLNVYLYFRDSDYTASTYIPIIIVTTIFRIVSRIAATTLVFTSCYNVSTWYLKEMEMMSALYQKRAAAPSDPTLINILPAVEGDHPLAFSYCISRQERTTSAERTYEQTYLVKCVCRLKRYRYCVNKWYYISLSFNTLFAATAIPFVLVLGFQCTTLYGISLGSVNAVFVVLPIILNEWVKYSGSYLATKLKKQIISTVDPLERRALHILVNSLRDEYPDSPCVLYEFNTLFLSTVIDAAVLIATTFLTA